MKNQTSLSIFGMILGCTLAIFQVGCSKPEPILIGFSGQWTNTVMRSALLFYNE